jgi:ABC-2 type transport system permease protein
MFKKYLAIINTFWQRALSYRFTVFSYRIGEIVEMVSLIVLWGAIFQNSVIIGGFTFEQMVTYIIIGNLFRTMVRNFLPSVIDRDIREGKLSLYLVRPMSYFEFVLVKEVGRISVATFMSTISQVVVTLFFIKLIIFNFDVIYLLLILIMLILAFLTELLVAYLVGLVAFWTDEAEGLYNSVDNLKRLFSGGYFPLSLLPSIFLNISFLLPFAYSFYIPTQIYLKKISLDQGVKGLVVQLIWIVILGLIIRFVWNKGIKKYEAVGI